MDLGTNNVGPVAAQTAQALLHRGVNFDASFARMPLQLKVSDLDSADRIVALKYTEHFPLMMDRFPSWISTNDIARIEYWEVHDVDQIAPELALPLIERQVSHLMARLHAEPNV